MNRRELLIGAAAIPVVGSILGEEVVAQVAPRDFRTIKFEQSLDVWSRLLKIEKRRVVFDLPVERWSEWHWGGYLGGIEVAELPDHMGPGWWHRQVRVIDHDIITIGLWYPDGYVNQHGPEKLLPHHIYCSESYGPARLWCMKMIDPRKGLDFDRTGTLA